jgi:hypothetical protein
MQVEWFVVKELAHQRQAEIAATNLKSLTTTVRCAVACNPT